MKTGIVVITFNIPSEIFVLQVQAMQKFCKDDFEVNIFDNSTDEAMSEAVRYHSERLEVAYKRLHSAGGGPSDSHSWAAQFSYNKLQADYDFMFYLDHDCLPYKDFYVEEILKERLYAGLAQKTPTYFWPGCFMLDNRNINPDLVDFSPSHELGLDTGGNLYKLIDFYGKDKAVFFSEAYCQNPHFRPGKYDHYSVIQDTFMHFIGASNWNNIEDNQARLNGLIAIAKQKTQI